MQVVVQILASTDKTAYKEFGSSHSISSYAKHVVSYMCQLCDVYV